MYELNEKSGISFRMSRSRANTLCAWMQTSRFFRFQKKFAIGLRKPPRRRPSTGIRIRFPREVTEAFAAYYGISPELVTAGNGSDELISILCSAFLMKGEAMMVILPDFSMYQFYASISEDAS